jgi:hypothetical protein
VDKEISILAIFVLIITALGAVVVVLLMSNQGPEPVACTADARICPDGTAVGRVPPDCEFAECPPFEPKPVGCPEDAMVCPDGTVVVRTPPDCEFEECPAEPELYCGDGICQTGEDCGTCSEDCGICIIESSPPEPEEDPCDQWVGLEKKAECYSLLAQNESDISYCGKIALDKLRQSCYRSFALDNMSFEACTYLKDSNEVLSCLRSVSGLLTGYEGCLGIPEDSLEMKNIRYDCLTRFAKKNLTDEPCKLIGHQAKRKECIEYVAFGLESLEGCLMLLEEDLWYPPDKYDCFVPVANDTRDVGLCRYIDSVLYKSMCIYEIVTDLRLSSNRCTGLSLDDEYLCRAIADDDETLCDYIRDNETRERCWSYKSYYCNETDGGIDYMDAGSVEYRGDMEEDYCEDGFYLVEYYCGAEDGEIAILGTTLFCASGCLDGACL